MKNRFGSAPARPAWCLRHCTPTILHILEKRKLNRPIAICGCKRASLKAKRRSYTTTGEKRSRSEPAEDAVVLAGSTMERPGQAMAHDLLDRVHGNGRLLGSFPGDPLPHTVCKLLCHSCITSTVKVQSGTKAAG